MTGVQTCALPICHKALAYGKPVPWHFAIAGVVVLLATVWATKPDVQPAAAVAAPATFAQVQAIVTQRCVLCHSAAVQSKGVRLDSADEIARQAQAIYQQSSVLKLMQ